MSTTTLGPTEAGETDLAGPRRARGRGLVGAAGPPLVLVVVSLGLWHVAASLLASAVVPTPLAALNTLVADLATAAFLASLGETLTALAFAYALAVVVGAGLGFLIGLSSFWTDVLSPLIYALYSIPKITLYPLFLVFLGLGAVSRTGFAMLHGVVPILLVVLAATVGVDRTHLKLAASYRLGTMATIRTIVVPSVVPALVTGMRLGFGLTFLGLLIAEMLGGSAGLGAQLLRNVQLVRMDGIVGQVVLVAAIALVPTTLLLALERRQTAAPSGRQ